MKVSILGTDYEVYEGDLNDRDFASAAGICYQYDKKIGFRQQKFMAGDSDEAKQVRRSQVIYHELVHAFCMESGVSYDDSEELTDWIARMIPKIVEAHEKIMRGL